MKQINQIADQVWFVFSFGASSKIRSHMVLLEKFMAFLGSSHGTLKHRNKGRVIYWSMHFLQGRVLSSGAYLPPTSLWCKCWNPLPTDEASKACWCLDNSHTFSHHEWEIRAGSCTGPSDSKVCGPGDQNSGRWLRVCNPCSQLLAWATSCLCHSICLYLNPLFSPRTVQSFRVPQIGCIAPKRLSWKPVWLILVVAVMNSVVTCK